MRKLFVAILAAAFVTAAGFSASAEDKKEEPKIIVPYVPTHPKVVTAMLKMASVKEGETVYDLGCGDGRIVIAAARQVGVGCEHALQPLLFAHYLLGALRIRPQIRVGGLLFNFG